MKTITELVKECLGDIGYHNYDFSKTLPDNGLDSLDITEFGIYLEEVIAREIASDIIEIDLEANGEFHQKANSLSITDLTIYIDGIYKQFQQSATMSK